jgi:ABC-type multidrug transport system fused ATPase/permease subunit
VSYRFYAIRMADPIVVLDKGRIAASEDDASLVRAGLTPSSTRCGRGAYR